MRLLRSVSKVPIKLICSVSMGSVSFWETRDFASRAGHTAGHTARPSNKRAFQADKKRCKSAANAAKLALLTQRQQASADLKRVAPVATMGADRV